MGFAQPVCGESAAAVYAHSLCRQSAGKTAAPNSVCDPCMGTHGGPTTLPGSAEVCCDCHALGSSPAVLLLPPQAIPVSQSNGPSMRPGSVLPPNLTRKTLPKPAAHKPCPKPWLQNLPQTLPTNPVPGSTKTLRTATRGKGPGEPPSMVQGMRRVVSSPGTSAILRCAEVVLSPKYCFRDSSNRGCLDCRKAQQHTRQHTRVPVQIKQVWNDHLWLWPQQLFECTCISHCLSNQVVLVPHTTVPTGPTSLEQLCHYHMLPAMCLT
jgi:hypothetical protein